MRKTLRRRPEVESLKSMTLLSVLVLTGSDHGTYSVKGTETATKGSGSVGPLGHVTTVGKSVSGGVGTVTLTGQDGDGVPHRQPEILGRWVPLGHLHDHRRHQGVCW
jgi:hypothetical protein